MIKIFVATKETQGRRENDFCFVPEGEIVTFPVMTCDNEETDGPCGCKRSLAGVVSRGATTTMKVDLFDGSILDLDRVIRESLRESGWMQEPYRHFVKEDYATRLSLEADLFPVGTVVEYRGDKFTMRNRN